MSPRLYLRRSNCIGALDVMSLSDVRDEPTDQRDCHLLHLSAELRRLGVSVAALSGVRSLRSGRISGVGTPTTCQAILRGIAMDWPSPSPTDWSL